MNNKALLEWQLAAGIDEATAEAPINYFAIKQQVTTSIPANHKTAAIVQEAKINSSHTPLHLVPLAASNAARELANKCDTLEELEDAVKNFEGCAIKKTATKTVFADGNPQAKIMLIGEAPGSQEDIQGIPFCGASGQLLDKMRLSIELDRSKIYISNTIFWRPPGNRQPSTHELATCLPFVEKHIALVNPKFLILSGGTATNALLQKDQSISRLRGKFYEYNNIYLNSPVKTALIYHPSYLLRQPLNKKQAWQDLLLIKQFIAS